jgi:hypothetical protein
MTFAKRLRERVRAGEITCSIRLWRWPHVKIGGRYPLAPGAIEVTGLTEIDLSDVTEDLAAASGFESPDDLMSVARHGRGERVFLVEFAYRQD